VVCFRFTTTTLGACSVFEAPHPSSAQHCASSYQQPSSDRLFSFQFSVSVPILYFVPQGLNCRGMTYACRTIASPTRTCACARTILWSRLCGGGMTYACRTIASPTRTCACARTILWSRLCGDGTVSCLLMWAAERSLYTRAGRHSDCRITNAKVGINQAHPGNSQL
jgi:hypothetical protein